MTGRLDSLAAELNRVTPLAASLADEALTGNLAAAESKLSRLRATLSSDPLSLWQSGPAPVDTSGADRLQERVTAAVTRVDELVRLRDDARQRITEVTTAAAAARAAYEDATAAWQRASAKISAEALPPPPPGVAELTARLADLDTLLAAGRWTRLAAELDEVEHELAAASGNLRATERTVVDVLNRRDELRGLLGAYQAKAARLGAAEDPGLTERYNYARGLLWTAPCDLAAAADAVTGYQQAVLALGGSPR
jgi:multidrug efflux pump subunit AcrA (membrane-fusion protein)